MTLLEECISALGNNTEKLSPQDTISAFQAMNLAFPMTSWGRIDWDKVENKIRITSINEAIEKLVGEQKRVEKIAYILWDEASLPALKTNLEKISQVIDDVIAVSFDTWIFCPSAQFVIEFYHEGEITVGWG
ncbi:MAG TPA: hypothetical protein PKA10_00010 [Selenomonadales bacterium]|nr:hypothetical protein [Selenomonadales bacterium]